MGEKITYDYFYGGQLEAFSYYRLPRVLVTGQQFRGLSTDAKLLYALLLDRMGLSSRNGWYDEQGRVYIYYPVEEIEEDIGCGHGKAVRLLAELDSAKGIGLIERVRQGQGRPTKIFVKQFTTVEVPDFPCPPPPTGGEPMPTSTKMGCQEVPKADGQKYQTHTSGLPKTGSLDVPKSNGNYNNINYPYESYLDLSIHPSYRLPVNETDRRAVLAELRENIDYPHLAARYGPEEVDELLELLTDTLCGTRPTIRVGSEEISAAAVKDRFWRLERHHMEYVLDRMRENIGQGPGWPEGSGSSSWPILEGGVLERYCLSPGQCSYFLALAQRVGCPPPPEIEALFLKQGGVYPSSAPFSPSVCGAPPSEGNAFSSATASDGQMTLFPPF